MVEEELNHDEDYIRLIKAVVDSAITDYVKLAHPKNRNKKYLQQCYLNAIAMFFEDDYKLESFTCLLEEQPLSTKELLSILISTPGVSMDKARQHVISESNKYWWEKNFNDITIPSSLSIYGKTYFTHNAANGYIDYNKNHIYVPLKKVGSDRLFFKLCLEIILNEVEITLDEDTFQKLHKVFYLFLKVNKAF